MQTSQGELIKLVSYDYIENYLVNYINEADTGLSERIELIIDRINTLESSGGPSNPPADETKEPADAVLKAYTEVKLVSGDKITLPKGSELVVISGHAKIVSGKVCDTTAAEMLTSNGEPEAYHMCIVVSSTVITAESGEVTIFIRGDYENG